MKKFIVFILLCVFLFTATLFKKEFSFQNMQNLNVQVFTSIVDNKLNNYSTVQNGQGQIVFCSYNEYQEIKKISNNICGVTFIFDGTENDFKNVIKDLKVKIIEQGDTNFVGYTNSFDSSVNYKNKKVNVQGYYFNNRIYIGTPLLLGSY